MRKEIYILIAVVMLTVCGTGQEQKESAEQTGYAMPGNGSEKATSGATEDGENVASGRRISGAVVSIRNAGGREAGK